MKILIIPSQNYFRFAFHSAAGCRSCVLRHDMGGRCAAVIFSIHFLTFCDTQSGWIRPHEMVKRSSSEEAALEGRCTSECLEDKRRLVECREQLEEARASQKTPSLEFVNQFKKFSRNLSESYCSQELDEHERFQVKFKFTQEQCRILASLPYSPPLDSDTLREIHGILYHFVNNFQKVSDIQLLSRWALLSHFCAEYFHGILTIMLTTFLFAYFLWVFSRIIITKRLVFACLVVLFVISIPWNWWYMYKKKEAEKMATLAKTGFKDPCAEASIWRRFTSYFSIQKDECRSHAEASNIHAAFEVTPLMAVSVTISRVFLEPLEYVGISLNKLFTSILQDLPILHQTAIIILLALLSIISLFLFCGYKIRTIFFTIGPSERNMGEVEDMKRRNEALEQKIMKLEERLKAKISYNGDEENKESKGVSHSGGGDSGTSDLRMTPGSPDSLKDEESVFSPGESPLSE